MNKVKNTSEAIYTISKKDIKLLKRKRDVNKSTFGKVTVTGGSKLMVGAPYMSYLASSALLTGCGYVTLAVPSSLLTAYQSRTVENMLFELSDKDGKYKFNKKNVDELIKNNPSIAIGMGMGKSEEVKKLVTYILKIGECNLLLDADGLNSIDVNTLKIKTNCKVVITPHIKELSRLINISTKTIEKDPIKYAKNLASKCHIEVLLKGTSSVVSNGYASYIISNGTPALSKGGSGDVLSGIIISLLAQGYSLDQASIYGQYILNECGKKASKKLGEASVIASDLVKELPKTIKEFTKG